ncbi:MAG: hypothetical protein ABI673_05690 [Novosphingobium sp.]
MPLISRLLSRMARQHGGKLIHRTVGRFMPAPPEAPVAKPGVASTLAGAALMRVATSSVPGAIFVGGGLVAKALHERRKAKREAGRDALSVQVAKSPAK